MTLTQAELKDVLSYDPETGIFRWRRSASRGTQQAGRIAGGVHTSQQGYHRIAVFGRMYKSHRLAWLYMTGTWPILEVDHENGVRDDNRWSNLRHATRRQNVINAGPRSDNTSGVKGVSWEARAHRWRVCANSEHSGWTSLGYYDDLESASARRKAAEKEHYAEWTPVRR